MVGITDDEIDKSTRKQKKKGMTFNPHVKVLYFPKERRLFTHCERLHTGTKTIIDKLEKSSEEQDSGGFLGLPEKKTELDNLTEFNTAHNRSISMVGITDDEIDKSIKKQKKKGITFNPRVKVLYVPKEKRLFAHYIISERFHTGTQTIIDKLEKSSEEQVSGMLFGLVETEAELDHLTKCNTAHNSRISMVGIQPIL